MANDIIAERKEKFKKILALYESREYRQEDIAKKLGIPISIVAKATKDGNFEHGKKKRFDNPNNLNEGQKICPVFDYHSMKYLDKHDIWYQIHW